MTLLRFSALIRCALLGLGLPLCSLALACPSRAETPLLMEGKTSLHQRVLIREITPRHSAPDQPLPDRLKPLQAFYVYAREGDWLQVGAEETGADLFWVRASATTDWKQNIVATLEGSENLGRLLFFDGYDSAYGVVEAEDPALAAAALRAEAEAAEAGGPRSERLVALGPRTTVDMRRNLYVMPILSSEEAVFENGNFVNLLQVAVARANPDRAEAPSASAAAPAPLTAADEVPLEDGEAPAPAAPGSGYRAGVVFVVDTTISMQPYIDATRAALTEIYAQAGRSGASDKFAFGLIGFRDDAAAVPGLDYQTRTFVTLQHGASPEKFLAGMEEMTEARVSTRSFREDSYAGIDQAISAIDWTGFGARFIVLVTDAGPREAGDPLSATGLSAEGLSALARERARAAIMVMHLRTPKGAKDHATAEAAYRRLAAQPNGDPLYFPIEKGTPEIYRQKAHDVGAFIVDQVTRFQDGASDLPDAPGVAAEPAPADAGLAAVASVGRTMHLAWLGSQKGEKAPDVFEAVVADRDFDRPGLKPLSIRVLISKSELSDLQEALKIIVQSAEDNVIDPDKFFAQVLGAAADMSRSPDKVKRCADASLADVTAISEYLEGLPYKSRIMAITNDDWLRLSISEQQTVVNELHEKIERYSRYNEATDAWVDYLGTGAGAAALVYPMRLDDLP